MIISLIGPSGSGKSTQAKLIAQKYNLTHLSVGTLFRSEIEKQSSLGQKLKTFVDQGIWAPDELAIEVIKNNIAPITYKNFIIDGFPRVLVQGKMFEEMLKLNGSSLTHIFHLNIPISTIYSRRLKTELVDHTRFSDAGRTDETPEAIANRQNSYDQSIIPILEYYTQKELLTQIDATPSVDIISNSIYQKINSLQNL